MSIFRIYSPLRNWEGRIIGYPTFEITQDNIIDGKYSGAILDLRNNLSEYIAQSLKKHLDAMNAIAEVSCEKDYIRSNTARDIANLHERLESWSLSILQASNNINQQQLTAKENEPIEAEVIDDDEEEPIS